MITDSEYRYAERRLGVVEIIVSTLLILVVIFFPSREGAPPSSKFYLSGFLLIWLGNGIRRYKLNKEDRRVHNEDNQPPAA